MIYQNWLSWKPWMSSEFTQKILINSFLLKLLQEINYDVLSELNLLDMCIQETLRLYSPAVL